MANASPKSNHLGWPGGDETRGETGETAEGVAERGAGAGWIEGDGGERRFARTTRLRADIGEGGDFVQFANVVHAERGVGENWEPVWLVDDDVAGDWDAGGKGDARGFGADARVPEFHQAFGAEGDESRG